LTDSLENMHALILWRWPTSVWVLLISTVSEARINGMSHFAVCLWNFMVWFLRRVIQKCIVDKKSIFIAFCSADYFIFVLPL